jgi:hypothetical protein
MVEAILTGSSHQGMMLEQLERPLPLSWDDQRGHLSAAGTSSTGTL